MSEGASSAENMSCGMQEEEGVVVDGCRVSKLNKGSNLLPVTVLVVGAANWSLIWTRNDVTCYKIVRVSSDWEQKYCALLKTTGHIAA